MRKAMISVLISAGLFIASPVGISAQPSDAQISGSSADCFAGTPYSPGNVEIYLYDASAAPEIVNELHRMQALAVRNDAPSRQRIFDSYNHLLHLVRVTKALQQTRSNRSGAFSFNPIPTGLSVVVLGIAPREDEPVFYAYREIKVLKSGHTSVVLDFMQGEKCGP